MEVYILAFQVATNFVYHISHLSKCFAERNAVYLKSSEIIFLKIIHLSVHLFSKMISIKCTCNLWKYWSIGEVIARGLVWFGLIIFNLIKYVYLIEPFWQFTLISRFVHQQKYEVNRYTAFSLKATTNIQWCSNICIVVI